MRRTLALAPLLAALAAAGLAQEPPRPSGQSRTEASQIEPVGAARASRAFLDEAGPAAPPRASLTEAPTAPAPTPDAPPAQLTARAQGTGAMAQLSNAELDATLAQLSAAERRVLLQAITGSDICDNPPDVAAILALCRTRIETRSGDFAKTPERALSAEERLLVGDLESGTLPSLDRVIERLARGDGSSSDPSNQAIAAIALGTGVTPSGNPGDKDKPEGPRLGEDTQALVNALLNQVGGGGASGGGTGP
jgi:hypothetical protein